MATQIIHRLIDDLDGGAAEETVSFALDGIEFTIDLSGKNAAKLRKIFQPYLAAGMKVTRRRRNGNVPIEDTTAGRDMIRTWARSTSKWPNLGDRGRIPREVIAAYYDANRR